MATLLIAVFLLSTLAITISATTDEITVDALVLNPRILTLTIVGEGTVNWVTTTPEFGTAPPQSTVNAEDGSVVTLTAFPSTDMKLTSWGDATVTTDPLVAEIVMDADKAVTVTFENKVVNIEVIIIGPVLEFYNVPWGGTSLSETVTVNNIGDYDVTITATISEEQRTFYKDYLEITDSETTPVTHVYGDTIPDEWTLTTITMTEGSEIYSLQLVDVWDAGSFFGKLIFWAEAT